jgi:hypothetical protein
VTTPPQRPLIYHITHVDNLPSILTDGGLLSDRLMVDRGGPKATIGMGSIKQRRLTLPVKCHPGDYVGDYVPFYFCPRSVMLYVIHMANHLELRYKGGQRPIVHLVADFHEVTAWADRDGRRWAFSLGNAGAGYAEFRTRREELDQLDWERVCSPDFRSPDVKEAKQCEFLIRDSFPWELVSRIGVRDMQIQERVEEVIAHVSHRPSVRVQPAWYY